MFKYNVSFELSGSNELENIKNQTSAVQDELRSMKPKIFEQFATISKEFFSLQRALLDVRRLMEEMKVRQHDGGGGVEEVGCDNDVLFPLKEDMTDWPPTGGASRRRSELDNKYSLRGEHSRWARSRQVHATHSAPESNRYSEV